MIEVINAREEVLKIIRFHAKKDTYLDLCIEKERLKEARMEMKLTMEDKWRNLPSIGTLY